MADILVAMKPFTMRGVDYLRGERVDTSNLPEHKISQLLNQRYLRPAGPGEPIDRVRDPEPQDSAT